MPIERIVYISIDDKRKAVVWPITRSCVRFERKRPLTQDFELVDEVTRTNLNAAKAIAARWTGK